MTSIVKCTAPAPSWPPAVQQPAPHPPHPLDSNLPWHAGPPVGAAKARHLRRNIGRQAEHLSQLCVHRDLWWQTSTHDATGPGKLEHTVHNPPGACAKHGGRVRRSRAHRQAQRRSSLGGCPHAGADRGASAPLLNVCQGGHLVSTHTQVPAHLQVAGVERWQREGGWGWRRTRGCRWVLVQPPHSNGQQGPPGCTRRSTGSWHQLAKASTSRHTCCQRA